jgi:hypothetical protein
MRVTTGGRRGFRMAGAALVAVLAVGLAGCSSSGPSAAAKGLCGSVSAQPIPTTEAVAVDTHSIKDGENSGNPELNAGATAYIKAINNPKRNALVAANNRIARECQRLGIPTANFNQ